MEDNYKNRIFLSKNKDKKRIMVILDSNHTHEHRLKEFETYLALISKGSYLVFDIIIEDMPQKYIKNRPHGIKNSLKTAVKEFLKKMNVSKLIENKILFIAEISGYLKCVKNISKN